MFKRFAVVLLVLGVSSALGAPLFAEEEASIPVSRASSAASAQTVRHQLNPATAVPLLRLTDPAAWLLSATGDVGARRTQKGKVGRKAMWITIAVSMAAVGVAAALAPEAPIPTTPGRTSGGCTSFHRWGTLMTTSGYTCRLN